MNIAKKKKITLPTFSNNTQLHPSEVSIFAQFSESMWSNTRTEFLMSQRAPIANLRASGSQLFTLQYIFYLTVKEFFTSNV